MVTQFCTHLADSITNIEGIEAILNHLNEIKCTDCECRGPNLWLCLYRNCFHIGCGEISNDHSTFHNAKDPNHCIHMNLSTRRTWCYMCKWEVFLDKVQSQPIHNENDQDNSCNVSLNQDSGHGSCSTLRAGSPNRGAIFENNTVGLNVGMNGEGDQSDNDSDMDDYYNDYTVASKQGGLVGLQNIGNTCYMNSALQALSNTEPLTRYFLDCAHIVHMLSEGKKPGLSRTYQTLIKDMWVRRSSQSYVTPSGILYGIRNVHAMFRGYHQHDTQEFLRNFMDQLHEELKQSAPPESSSGGDGDSFSLAVEEPLIVSTNYDSSEGEYETCDSGVSERSSLSDDTEISHKNPGFNINAAKRRLSRCGSPGRRQRQRVQSGSIIETQPSSSSSNSSTSNKKQVKYRSIISDIFDGKLLSSVQCLTCDRVSSRIETFQDLSLPIPSRDHLVVLHGRNTTLPSSATCSDALVPVQDGWVSWILTWLRSWFYGPTVTLHDCLSAFFSTDELKGDNMYSCEKCNKLRNGIKFSKVLQLPEVLCIHLKRFRHELMYSSKISSAVSFPLKGLDMWPYLHQSVNTKVSSYDLFSVICHHGTAGGGHYTSYALNNGQWYEFDDQYVTKVSSERVQNCEAYVLFYRKSQITAEPIRHKATQMAAEAVKKGCENIKKAYISRQWLTRFYYCVEPGPIDNTDFLCHHGSFDPDREHILEHLACEVPYELYDYLYKRFGGCPPITSPTICPACTALQHRLITEMKAFSEISRQAQIEDRPNTHYLSTSWYSQWHNFVERTTKDPPGPIDNTKINLANLDHNEAAEVPECIFDFFYNIYGGGPVLSLPSENEEQVESEGQEDPAVEQTLVDWENRNGDTTPQCNGCDVMDTEQSEEEPVQTATSSSEKETEVSTKTENSTAGKTEQKTHGRSRSSRYRRRSTRSSVH